MSRERFNLGSFATWTPAEGVVELPGTGRLGPDAVPPFPDTSAAGVRGHVHPRLVAADPDSILIPPRQSPVLRQVFDKGSPCSQEHSGDLAGRFSSTIQFVCRGLDDGVVLSYQERDRCHYDFVVASVGACTGEAIGGDTWWDTPEGMALLDAHGLTAPSSAEGPSGDQSPQPPVAPEAPLPTGTLQTPDTMLPTETPMMPSETPAAALPGAAPSPIPRPPGSVMVEHSSAPPPAHADDGATNGESTDSQMARQAHAHTHPVLHGHPHDHSEL